MTKKSIAFLLSLIILLSLASWIQQVHAATNNVYQTRYLAEISSFPESYQPGLAKIKEAYPNAEFLYYDTGLDWYSDLLAPDNQLKMGRNLIPSSSPDSWKSIEPNAYNAETGEYVAVEPGWNQASQSVIEYYMDPRNFLNEKDIFQFVNLSFDGAQTVEGVESILSGTFMDGTMIADDNGNSITYAQTFYNIGKETNVSPYLLASRVRQEQGGGGSSMISGTHSEYPGYYNYFNIGANGSSSAKIIANGLSYAKNHGWDTQYKSLLGGAQHLSSDYVGAGKNCFYLHHWNVVASSSHTVSYLPYMTNLLAPYYEARRTASSYTDRNAGYTFIIPVYYNMPANPVTLPGENESNANMLKGLSINGGEVSIGTFNSNTFDYVAETSTGLEYVTLKLTAFSNVSDVAINGIGVELDGNNEVEKAIILSPGFNTVKISVTAPNGLCKYYNIEIINNDGVPHYRSSLVDFTKTIDSKLQIYETISVNVFKNNIDTINCSAIIVDENNRIKNDNDPCVTGDSLLFKTSDNKITKKYDIIFNGDLDGDGKITDDDVDIMRDHIMELITLDNKSIRVADMNLDGQVTIVDLGLVKSKTDSQFANTANSATLYVITDGDVYSNKRTKVSIESTPGTYFVDGYLVYNEGKVVAKNANNSGRIHFISDGTNTVFENGLCYLDFAPLVLSGTIDFDIEINNSFNFFKYKKMNVSVVGASSEIRTTELDLDVELNSSNLLYSGNNISGATLIIKNMSLKDVGKIKVELGEYFKAGNGKKTIVLNGLNAKESHAVELYATNTAPIGEYTSDIKVTYKNAKGAETILQTSATMSVFQHTHEPTWKSNEDEHFFTCRNCGESESGAHRYIKISDFEYACSDCNYKQNVSLDIENDVNVVGQASIFTPVINANDKELEDDYIVNWYVDGEFVSDSKVLSVIFRSVGTRIITCMAKTDDGIVLIKTLNVSVPRTNSSDEDRIAILATSCHEIMTVKRDNCVYRIDKGEWQESNIFDNLESGVEYMVYQKDLKTGKITSMMQYLNHSVLGLSSEALYCSNAVLNGECEGCKTSISFEIKDSAVECEFLNYEKISDATCLSGSIEESQCEYGCGKTESRELNDELKHSFTNYVYDENSNCFSAGTCTSKCAYDCGETHTKAYTEMSVGHEYEYMEIEAATATSCKKELGVCKRCGHENERFVVGTRLMPIDYVHVVVWLGSGTEMSKLVSMDTEGVEVVDVTWTDKNGNIVEDKLNFSEGESYTLSSLTIKADDDHSLCDIVDVYVNGKLYAAEVEVEKEIIAVEMAEIEESKIVLKNIGSFKI